MRWFRGAMLPTLSTAMIHAAAAQSQVTVGETQPWYSQGDPVFGVPVFAWIIGLSFTALFLYLGITRGGKR